jgi:ABC-type branched-subunit amino acid transport system substrate-binding protein
MTTSMTLGGSLRLGLACAFALALGACSSGQRRAGPPAPQAASNAIETAPLAAAGDLSRMGNGAVKIALIAPITGSNGVGVSMRNAAELAVAAFDSPAATLIVKDDRSSPAGAKAAAQAAIAEGAQLILGPLFAANAREAGAVARAAGKPMIAFSTDPALAGNGVYLLAFLTRSYVDRIVDFAAARGKRSMAALIPDSDQGRIAEAAFMAAAARNNIRVDAVERVQSDAYADAAAQRIANLGAGIDALFIPAPAEAMAGIAQSLSRAGIDGGRVQILGTGLWNDARVLKIRSLQGAWFAAPDNAGFASFAASYRERFNAEPARVATLAYDAVALSLALAREGYTARTIEGASGFNGLDGVFRFGPDGLSERGLGVQMIDRGSTTLVSPAPKSF